MPTKPPSFRAPSIRSDYDQTKRRTDPALRAAAAFRSSKAWQQIRAQHRAQHPLCCDPFGVHGDAPPLMADVHHIHGVASAPSLARTASNLASLCRACHTRVEALERAGKGTQWLFVRK